MSRCLFPFRRFSVWPSFVHRRYCSLASSPHQSDEVVNNLSETSKTSFKKDATNVDHISACSLKSLPDMKCDFLKLDFRDRLKLVLAEYEIWKRMDNSGVPEVLLFSQLERLCVLEPRLARYMYLCSLGHLERRYTQKRVRGMFCYGYLKQHGLVDSSSSDARPSSDSKASAILLQKLSENIKQLCAQRHVTAAMCGSPQVVIDMSWQSKLNIVERHHVCTQFLRAIRRNYENSDPFRLRVTSFSEHHWLDIAALRWRYVTSTASYGYFVQYSDRHFTELFPREKLIYLTPDSENELVEFNPDKVYVMGAIVDIFASDIRTVDKAREAGIATARLPLELCFDFAPLNLRLSFSDVFSVLLQLYQHNQIFDALDNLPTPSFRRMSKRKLLVQQAEKKLQRANT